MAVGHESSQMMQEASRVGPVSDLTRKKERRKAAVGTRTLVEKGTGSGYGTKVEACLAHVQDLKDRHTGEIASAHIDMQGTPTEKFWADPGTAYSERRCQAISFLRVVYPEQLQPLCTRLDGLALKARCTACLTDASYLAASAALPCHPCTAAPDLCANVLVCTPFEDGGCIEHKPHMKRLLMHSAVFGDYYVIRAVTCRATWCRDGPRSRMPGRQSGRAMS
jgi:hypothetical protein